MTQVSLPAISLSPSTKAAVHSYATGWAGVGLFLLAALLSYGPFQVWLQGHTPAIIAQYLPPLFAFAGTAMTWLGKGPFSRPDPVQSANPTAITFPPNPFAASGAAAGEVAVPKLAGQIANAAVAALEANETAVTELLANIEGGAEAKIEELVNAYTPPEKSPLLLVWAYLKPAALAQLKAAEAANPGSVLYKWILDEAKTLAAQLNA